MSRILYLHGFASGPGSKKAQFFRKQLAGHGVDMEVPDLAEGDFEHLTITGQLKVIERAIAGQPISVIGSSLGGYLAAQYAASHPEVERLVLMAPAFSFSKRWAALLGESQMEAWERTGSLGVFHYGDGRERRLGYQLALDSRQYPDFPKFSQPALIFHGDGDTVVPLELSIQFAALHPNARLVILHSDHELTNVLDPMWEQASSFLLS